MQDEIPIIESIAAIGRNYSAWLVDVWGVIHNGVRPFAPAVEACARHRANGGHVILLTNAPRPAPAIVAQLQQIGVPKGAYDGVVTSGDVTRGLLEIWKHRPICHVGPERDLPLFEGLGITFSTTIDAEVVACTGLEDDERETAADYAHVLDRFRRRGAVMICANPDIKVERGDRIIYCAGALGEAYEKLDGEVLYAGKPHPPIYELAKSVIEDVAGRSVGMSDILAIGDGVFTDIKGAGDAGIDSVYISSPVNLEGGVLTPEALAAAFRDAPHRPLAALPALAP